MKSASNGYLIRETYTLSEKPALLFQKQMFFCTFAKLFTDIASIFFHLSQNHFHL